MLTIQATHRNAPTEGNAPANGSTKGELYTCISTHTKGNGHAKQGRRTAAAAKHSLSKTSAMRFKWPCSSQSMQQPATTQPSNQDCSCSPGPVDVLPAQLSCCMARRTQNTTQMDTHTGGHRYTGTDTHRSGLQECACDFNRTGQEGRTMPLRRSQHTCTHTHAHTKRKECRV